MKALLLRFVCILYIFHNCQGQDFRTPIGNPCNESDECESNYECVTSFCQCKSGYSATPGLECKVNYNGNCLEDDDCNVFMGLGCVKSFCQCTDSLEQAYVQEIGGCINSTMKIMYDEIMNVVNQTEYELTKFTTLLHIFMAHGSANKVDSPPLAPDALLQLQELEDQFRAAQGIVEVIVAPDNSTSTPVVVTQAAPAPIVTTQAAPAPTVITQAAPAPTVTTQAAPAPTATTQAAPVVVTQAAPVVVSQVPLSVISQVTPILVSELTPEVRAQNERPNLRQVSPTPPTLPGIPTTLPTPSAPLPNSFSNLILPIQTVPSTGAGGQATLQNLGSSGLPNLGPPGSGGADSLTNVLPQFLNMFNQFLPFLQSFNNVLGSSILTQNNLPRQGQVGQVNPSIFGQLGNLGGGGGAPGGGIGGLLQIPQRIFGSLFGRNSTINQLKRRIIPFDFERRAIPFLPWPLG